MADLRGALISWSWKHPPLDMVTERVIRVPEEIFFFLNIHQMTASFEGLAQVRLGLI